MIERGNMKTLSYWRLIPTLCGILVSNMRRRYLSSGSLEADYNLLLQDKQRELLFKLLKTSSTTEQILALGDREGSMFLVNKPDKRLYSHVSHMHCSWKALVDSESTASVNGWDFIFTFVAMASWKCFTSPRTGTVLGPSPTARTRRQLQSGEKVVITQPGETLWGKLCPVLWLGVCGKRFSTSQRWKHRRADMSYYSFGLHQPLLYITKNTTNKKLLLGDKLQMRGYPSILFLVFFHYVTITQLDNLTVMTIYYKIQCLICNMLLLKKTKGIWRCPLRPCWERLTFLKCFCRIWEKENTFEA